MKKNINNIENVWAVWTRRLSFFVFGLITSSWTLHLYNTRFKAIENLDWVMFQDTARLLLESRVRDIYPGITENLPFFYPPYFIPLIAPLGLLSRSWGYTSIVLSMIAAMAVALWILRRALPWNGPGYATGVLVVLSSASWNEMVILGHLGALYLLVLVSGLLLWIRHRRFLAGALLSLMMLKPNLGLIFLPIFLVRRQWSLLVGWIGGLTLLVSSTLPMGLRIWLDYACSFRTLATVVGTQIPMWKQQTIYAFWQSLPGMHQSSQALALWIASSLPLLAITAAAWLKMKPDAQHLPRLFSLTVLTIVSCNIYLFVYDGLLLALPGMVWYMDRGSYRYTGCRMVAGVAILVIYVWQHLTAWIIHGGWALVGPTVAIWLIADAWDLLRT